MTRKEPTTKELARLVRQVRKEAEAFDLRAFQPAARLAGSEREAIKTSVVQTLRTAECILGGRGVALQDHYLRQGAHETAAAMLGGLVLMHNANTAAKED